MKREDRRKERMKEGKVEKWDREKIIGKVRSRSRDNILFRNQKENVKKE